jgi:predicted transcriptional regulator
MSTRLNVILSDDLDKAIEAVVAESESTKSDVLRKALQLYLAAHDGKRRGLKLGLVEPDSGELRTEIVGL